MVTHLIYKVVLEMEQLKPKKYSLKIYTFVKYFTANLIRKKG